MFIVVGRELLNAVLKGLVEVVQSFYEEKGVNLKQIAKQMIPTVSSTEKMCSLTY